MSYDVTWPHIVMPKIAITERDEELVQIDHLYNNWVKRSPELWRHVTPARVIVIALAVEQIFVPWKWNIFEVSNKTTWISFLFVSSNILISKILVIVNVWKLRSQGPPDPAEGSMDRSGVREIPPSDPLHDPTFCFSHSTPLEPPIPNHWPRHCFISCNKNSIHVLARMHLSTNKNRLTAVILTVVCHNRTEWPLRVNFAVT